MSPHAYWSRPWIVFITEIKLEFSTPTLNKTYPPIMVFFNRFYNSWGLVGTRRNLSWHERDQVNTWCAPLPVLYFCLALLNVQWFHTSPTLAWTQLLERQPLALWHVKSACPWGPDSWLLPPRHGTWHAH